VIGGEHLNLGPVPPGVLGQAGLEASLTEKGLSVPTKFRGDLGEEKAMSPPLADVEAMSADFYRGRVRYAPQRGEDRDLQSEFGQLLGDHG
jgi:hypothetical protein